MKISTDIFVNNQKYRLQYGISNKCEYHIWEVTLCSDTWMEYIHDPKRIKVTELYDNRFSLIQYIDSDNPEQLHLFDGSRYVTRSELYNDIINDTKYHIQSTDKT